MAEGEHLGVSTTPPPTPSEKTLKKQWLEVLSTYQYVLCFCFLGLFFSLAGFLLLFTSLWYLSLLYLVWLFLDWDTPQQGDWALAFSVFLPSSCPLPPQLVKTAELPPDRNYVLGSHPHGVIAVGSGTGLSQLFPGLRFSMAVLNCLLYLPGHREYFLSCGACSVNRQSLDYVLSQSQLGRAVVIVVGGANEALYAVPGEHCLTLRNRKGFVRLALRHGASLVPVYSFGENDIFRVKAFAPDSWQHLLQVTIKKLLSCSPCIFWGRGLFSAKSWGLLPLARPITTVVGRPILVPQCPQPTEEQVDHYHRLYMKALEQLFEEHKESCGLPASTRLTFI
uniref:Acyltransferase n=1 Tax=Capra hircus TaxID=9925 RepID=A0A452E2N4_CAPHI